MNNSIPEEILRQHFEYFSHSIFRFPEKYLHLVFKENAEIPKHVVYLCPLCLESFLIGFEQGLLPSTDFTMDHFPPKSVGGVSTIITCKKCNNDAGRLYEAELLKKMHYEASKNNYFNAEIKTTVNVAGVPGNYASFVKKNTEGVIILDFPTKAKSKTPFLNSWLDNTGKADDWEIKLTVPIPDDKKILRAVLKTAYLICFLNWGYDFIFSTNGKLIRDVLEDRADYPTGFLTFWMDVTNLPKEKQIPCGLCIIEKPVTMQTFIVNIPLTLHEYSCIASILIPTPGEEGWNKINEIQEGLRENPTNEMTFTQVIPSLPNILNGYSKTWNDFIARTSISKENLSE